MPLMDEFREERQAIKNKSLKEKLSYFFYYYKWHVAGVIALVIALIALINNIVHHKDWGFYVCMINTAAFPTAEEYIGEFTEYAGIDTDKYEAVFDTDMYLNEDMTGRETGATLQKITVYATVADIDAMIAENVSFQRYAYNDCFMDLRRLLTPELTALCEPYFYYMDKTVAADVKAANESGQTYSGPYPDPRDPSAMKDPVPVGIYLDSCTRLKEHFYFGDGDREMILGVYVNSSRTDTALKWISFLFREQPLTEPPL